MAATLIALGVGSGVLALGGAVSSQVENGQTTATTGAIIGAVAVVLVAVIGVIGNYISNRRTAPSPPGPDTHDIAVHDRITVVEANLTDIRRRLNRIEDRLWPTD